MSRYEIRLGGSGGQGLVLAGVILGEASAIYEGRNAVQSQSYGPEARGGMSKSDVIISDEEIDYPKACKVNLLLALTQKSFIGYAKDVVPGGTILYDSDRVKEIVGGDYRLIGLPIIAEAVKETGKAMVANIVSLGAIVEFTGVVSKEALEKAVAARAPKGTEEMNLKALRAGYALVKQGAK